MIVAGMRLSGGIMVETSEPSVWGGDVVVAATLNRRGRLLGLGMLRGSNLEEEEWISNWEWRLLVVVNEKGERVDGSERKGFGLR